MFHFKLPFYFACIVMLKYGDRLGDARAGSRGGGSGRRDGGRDWGGGGHVQARTETARPKLVLAPRTVPITAPQTMEKSSIFGEGKPRDELRK